MSQIINSSPDPEPEICSHDALTAGSAVTRVLQPDGSLKYHVAHFRVFCPLCQTQFVFDGAPVIVESGIELRCLVKPKLNPTKPSIVVPKFRLRGRKPLDQ